MQLKFTIKSKITILFLVAVKLLILSKNCFLDLNELVTKIILKNKTEKHNLYPYRSSPTYPSSKIILFKMYLQIIFSRYLILLYKISSKN